MEKATLSPKELLDMINESFRAGGDFRFFPQGTSMLPLIRPLKDSVMLSPVTDLKRDGIYLFVRENGTTVLHRLFKIKKNGSCVFVGDNRGFKETVRQESIVAAVSAIFRFDAKNGTVLDMESEEYRRYCRRIRRRYPIRRLKHLKNAIRYRLEKR